MSAEVIQAIKTGDHAQVKRLLEQNPAVAATQTENGISAIMLAMYYHQFEIAQLLAGYREGLTLSEAVALGRVEQVAELLDQEPEQVHTLSSDGFPMLGYAAYFGQPAVVKLLLERGANPNVAAQNAMHVMPLHSALAHSNPAIALRMAEALLEKGAEVNVGQEGGFTPLHEAAQNGSVEQVKLLLRYGADPHAQTAEGKTPLELAADFPEVRALLGAVDR